MDENEKKLLESLRNFDITKLFLANTYADIEIRDLYQCFIRKIESNNAFSIHLPNRDSDILAPKNMLKYFGEDDHFENYKLRNSVIDPDLSQTNFTEIIKSINENLKSLNIILPDDEIISSKKEENISNNPLSSVGENLKKNLIKDDKGNTIDITGYLTYQLLEGKLNDCLCILRDNLDHPYSLGFLEKELFEAILDIIIYCGNVVKSNLKYYKTAYYNRKLLIVSQIHAILAGFDSLISNLLPFFKYIRNTYVDLIKKLNTIINVVYEIVLQSKNSNSIPLQSLINFIRLITYQLANGNIEKYDKDQVYLILKDHMKNLDKNELIFFKSDSSIKEICNKLISNLFNYNTDTYTNEIYYSYLFSCLKCDNLEKKLNALNEINNIITFDLYKGKSMNTIFKEFIDKNNILDMFFDDNTHEEIVKRAGGLFKYLAKFNCLNDNIIEKIIEKQKKNSLMSDILMEIISVLSEEKKKVLFKRLSNGLKLDDVNSNNLDYLSKLTTACFNSSKIRHSEKDNEEEIKIMEEENDFNYYGLSIIFDYILHNFNDKMNYEETNVEKAINCFEDTIEEIGDNSLFGIEEISSFLEKLFENIKSNEKHNSIIQSIKLVQRLLNIIDRDFDKNLEDILKKLDEKFDIITLLKDDLIRYLNIIDNNHSPEEIYEGIYPHSTNISQRLNLIFYFLKKNYDFMVKGKKHLEKLYNIFKPEKFKEERKKFNDIMTKNIGKLNNEILTEFYKDILQNKDDFDLTKINDNESINLIIQIFKQINFNKSSILNDGRKIRVEENAKIEGLDMLFTLLTQNSNEMVQERVSELLCQLCLYHKKYSDELLSSYWVEYFKKINVYFDEIIKTKNKVMLNGTFKLIDKIYTKCGHMEGNIMGKGNYKVPRKNYKEYHFYDLDSQKSGKLKAGNNDNFIELRYKISWYYDIPVNNVCMIDLDGNEYNLNNDFENFSKIFSDEKYFYKKGFEYVKVKIVPFEISKMKDNPKSLIENNEKIYKILIDSLIFNSDNDNNEGDSIKEKFWSILVRLPWNFYFENYLHKFGNKEKIEEQELSRIFNINNIYIFTYYLQCIFNFIVNNKIESSIKQEYLSNLIEVHHIDKLIINNFLNISIDSNNCNIIKFDCINIIINIMYKIEDYKKKKVDFVGEKISEQKTLLNDIFRKFTDIIHMFLKINNNSDDNVIHLEELDNGIDEKMINLGKLIFYFVSYISNEENNYIQFIFKDREKFIQIFVKDYIKCENDKLEQVIEQYLSEKFQDKTDYFLNYLNIVLTETLFNYLIKNDETGNYFSCISFMIQKYLEKKENKELESKTTPEFVSNLKKLVDLILNYVDKEIEKLEKKLETENKDNEFTEFNERENMKIFRNKENFKEELFQFLSNIINLQPKELVNYIINKVDICDYFLKKCNLRKCVEKPLETPDSFCLKNQSKTSVHKLILNIIRNADAENQFKIYNQVIDILDNYNKTGFWKTFNIRNWDIEYRETPKARYIGLLNMNSTCYLNSIIQQLYMIPTFRETIIKIENPSKDNILYELQLLFSALKIYEYPYYDPRSFVIANKLNFTEQMDADEFYGTLIDKIEKDIKSIYCNKNIDENEENKKDTYKYKDIFNYFFGIKVLDELQFVDCGHKRYNEFCYYNIQIEIKNCNNIYESLNNYFKAEVMDGDNKINCEECKTKRICHKHLLLKSLPHTLVISLKRFEFDYETMLKFKLNKYFEFPFQLDMKDYMIENHTEKSTEYDLTGIVVHNGKSDWGHYYDLIKGPDNKWYKFNDESISTFKEEDIPNEAFGNKDDDDDDYDRENGNEKRNAYILFYTKKPKNNDNNNEELEKYDLSLPPYNKYSNIKNDIKDIINCKLNESWIIQNIFSPWYQNFVLGLFKIHYDKKKIIEMSKSSSISDEEGEENKNDKEKMKEEKEEIYDIDEMDDKIFIFFIRYFVNVVCRTSKRNIDKTKSKIYKFKEIILKYIDDDTKRAKYILEEFSNNEALDEYLTYCPLKYEVSNFIELINKSFIIVFQNSNMKIENNLVFAFFNTILTYIASNILKINLENANNIFVKMINIDSGLFLDHMRDRGLKNWIILLIRKELNDESFNSIFNEENFPTIHSNHSIFIEKTMNTKEKYIDLRNKKIEDEKDYFDFQFLNGLNDMESNNSLVVQLKNHL